MKRIQFSSKHLGLLFIFTVLALGTTVTVFAAYPGTPFVPSDQELDPPCSPGASNCYVELPTGGGSATATNGLSLFGSDIGLGGTLTATTTIDRDENSLIFSSASGSQTNALVLSQDARSFIIPSLSGAPSAVPFFGFSLLDSATTSTYINEGIIDLDSFGLGRGYVNEFSTGNGSEEKFSFSFLNSQSTWSYEDAGGDFSAVRLYDGNIEFNFHPSVGTVYYRFPKTAGTSNYVLTTNGSGQLSWQDPVVLASDASLKENIQDIEYGLDTLRLLRPVSYDFTPNGKHQIGFIAQEVEELVPELVSEVASGKKGIAYAYMNSLIVKSIQELDQQVAELQVGNGADGESVFTRLATWLSSTTDKVIGGIVTFTHKITAPEVQTDRLCIGSTCVTEQDLIRMIQNEQAPPVLEIQETGNEAQATTTSEV